MSEVCGVKSEGEIRSMLAIMPERTPLTHEEYEARGYRNALAWVLAGQNPFLVAYGEKPQERKVKP